MEYKFVKHIVMTPENMKSNRVSYCMSQYVPINRLKFSIPSHRCGYTNLRIVSSNYNIFDSIALQFGGIDFDIVHPKFQQNFSDDAKEGYFFDIMGKNHVVPACRYHEYRTNVTLNSVDVDNRNYTIEFDLVEIKTDSESNFGLEDYKIIDNKIIDNNNKITQYFTETKKYKYEKGKTFLYGQISNIIILSSVKYDKLSMCENIDFYLSDQMNNGYYMYFETNLPHNNLNKFKVELMDNSREIHDDVHIYVSVMSSYTTDGSIIGKDFKNNIYQK